VKDEVVRREIQRLVEETRELTVSVQVEPFKTGFSKYETKWISDAPVHIVVCADPKKTAPHVGGQETYKYAVGAAIQNLMLTAYALGLGTCWLTMFDKNKLRALLGVPIEIDIIGVITVGYPKEVPEVPETLKRYGGKPRCDLTEIVFLEKYGRRASLSL
jgi:5,6-dimethylbenzimidazole synthase